ncbi:MAG TPA: histidine phosphatase family protein [Candidatus Dormibacteraeota bacterium]|nr:histidine phosphatase family protein [Candidatus Dormibacteraeota bacterium]
MRLYLVRHGIAIDRTDPACPADPARPLTPRGEARTRRVARGLHELGIRPQMMMTSPLLRAVQTAEIFCEVLGSTVSRLRRTDNLMPDSTPAALLGELARIKVRDVMCFGHAPNLDGVIAAAAGQGKPFTQLKKSAVALLGIDSFEPPRAWLRWLYNPGILRRLGR